MARISFLGPRAAWVSGSAPCHSEVLELPTTENPGPGRTSLAKNREPRASELEAPIFSKAKYRF